MAAVSERVQDMETLSKDLLKVMVGGVAVNKLKHNLTKQEQMIDKLLDTKKTAVQLIKGDSPMFHCVIAAVPV